MADQKILKKELQEIFRDVRDHFIWTADGEHELHYDGNVIRMNEHWGLMQPDARGVLRGDCEDFSLYCSKQVKERLKLHKSRRNLTYCRTETGEGHMILCVRIDDDEYVFDNRQRKLTTLGRLRRAGYSDFARPEGSINGPWSSL